MTNNGFSAPPPLGRNFENFDQVLHELGLDDDFVSVFDALPSFDSSFIQGQM